MSGATVFVFFTRTRFLNRVTVLTLVFNLVLHAVTRRAVVTVLTLVNHRVSTSV
jgi:hypothetical protein